MAASTKQKEPVKRVAKSVREAKPVIQTAPPPRVQTQGAQAASPARELPVPDLSAFGISASDTRAHVGVCESCGRGYRHVAKNPKDVTALQYFGRNLASCLAVNASSRGDSAGHAAP